MPSPDPPDARLAAAVSQAEAAIETLRKQAQSGTAAAEEAWNALIKIARDASRPIGPPPEMPGQAQSSAGAGSDEPSFDRDSSERT